MFALASLFCLKCIIYKVVAAQALSFRLLLSTTIHFSKHESTELRRCPGSGSRVMGSDEHAASHVRLPRVRGGCPCSSGLP